MERRCPSCSQRGALKLRRFDAHYYFKCASCGRTFEAEPITEAGALSYRPGKPTIHKTTDK